MLRSISNERGRVRPERSESEALVSLFFLRKLVDTETNASLFALRARPYTARSLFATLDPMVSTGQELAPDPSVLADQQLLARGGFYVGTPNGYADENHIAAIRRAREALGLPEGTAFDATLRTRLQRAVTPPEAPAPVATPPPVGTPPPAPPPVPPPPVLGQFPMPRIRTAPAAPAADSMFVPIVVGGIGLIIGFTWTALLYNRRR